MCAEPGQPGGIAAAFDRNMISSQVVRKALSLEMGYRDGATVSLHVICVQMKISKLSSDISNWK